MTCPAIPRWNSEREPRFSGSDGYQDAWSGRSHRSPAEPWDDMEFRIERRIASIGAKFAHIRRLLVALFGGS